MKIHLIVAALCQGLIFHTLHAAADETTQGTVEDENAQLRKELAAAKEEAASARAAVQAAKAQLTPSQKARAAEFGQYDGDNNGLLNAKEIALMLKISGDPKLNWKKYDVNDDGLIQMEEYMKLMEQKTIVSVAKAQFTPSQKARAAEFDQYDGDSNGLLNAKEVALMLKI